MFQLFPGSSLQWYNFKKKKIVRYAHVNLCHFFLPPGDRGWPRLLLLALPGLFCLPFFVIIKLFLRKTCLDEVSIKINNLVSYTYAIVNISASARDYLSFRRLLQTTFENLTRNIYSLALISKNIRKKVKTEHICLFFVCLFFFFIYFTLLFLFYFILFSFFLSFFLSFFHYFFTYLFICLETFLHCKCFLASHAQFHQVGHHVIN